MAAKEKDRWPPSRVEPTGHPYIPRARPPKLPSTSKAGPRPAPAAAKFSFHREGAQNGRAQSHRCQASAPQTAELPQLRDIASRTRRAPASLRPATRSPPAATTHTPVCATRSSSGPRNPGPHGSELHDFPLHGFELHTSCPRSIWPKTSAAELASKVTSVTKIVMFISNGRSRDN